MISAIVVLFLIFLIGAALYKMVSGDKKVLNKASSSNKIPAKTEPPVLSDCSNTILLHFETLDPEARPVDNLIPVLVALDTKFKDSDPDSHFNTYNFSHPWRDSGYNENTNHIECYEKIYGDGCPYQEYVDLYESILAVRDAYKARDRALELAGIENDLSQVAIITSRLRDEASIANAVAKELGVKQ